METTRQRPTHNEYRNNPTEVVTAWTRQLRQLVHDDTQGNWFAFTLTTALSEYQLQQMLHVRSATTAKFCGLHAHNQTAGQRKHRGVCAFLLPAVSYAGFPHCHGLLRVPRHYCINDRCITISEHGQRRQILVPASVRTFFEFPKYAELNLHLLYQSSHELSGTVLRALPLHEDPHAASVRVLDYWSHRTDGELRRFDEAEWCPWDVRSALPNADTTKRGAW